MDSEVQTAINTPARPDQAMVASRLLGTARELLAQGLALYEVEARIFAALRPGADVAAAVRGRLFRLMIGMTETPLSKTQASDLTGAVMRALRSSPDLEFSRLMVRACLLNNLLQAAFDGAEDLRREQIEVTRPNLKAAMMFAIINCRPRSQLIPWHADHFNVEAMLDVALSDYFGE